MAKRFKLKISRVISSFQLCRSKKASNLPESPVAVTHGLSPVNPKALDISFPNVPAPPPSTPSEYSFVKRHLSPKIASVGCGCRARSCTQYISPEVSFESPDYSWKKEATRLHVVAKARDSRLQRKSYEPAFSDESNRDVASVLVSKNYSAKKKEKKMEKKKAIASVSSRDSTGCFSSEEAETEETETLISTSLSFSDDSSIEFDHPFESITEQGSRMETKKNKKKTNATKKMIRLRSFGSKKYNRASNSSEDETPARGSMLRRMMPDAAAEGKVNDSVAVVKKSEDPYEDFKRSMLEMILEKQMFEAKDLEQLLQCFLSLNSRQYHETIVEAFTEIWEALFCDYPMNVV